MMNESRTDILINRIASSEASRGEFAEFEHAAVADPREWERLARLLRDELHMRSALASAIDDDSTAEIERAIDRSRNARSEFAPRRWSGWAVAAVVALAWTVSLMMNRTGETPVPPPTSGVQLASLTADEALEQYLRAGESEGRLVRELPTVLVETYPREDGGLEIYYVRQILEREAVSRVYELAEDEHGGYVPVQIQTTSFTSLPSSL
jgi:anti-sigma factor RsiW